MKSFSQYKQLREVNEPKAESNPEEGGLSTKVTLGDGNDFEPLQISDDPKSEHYGKNRNLAPIVRAFKQGANWGWSKDDKSGEDKAVKVGSKKLFLAGGSVRDHLTGKKARNTELATNSSPDEVYHILKQNGFEFQGGDGEVKKSHEDTPNKKAGAKQTFWVDKTNKDGRPFVFGIQVNNDKFELEIFNKTPRGTDGDPASGSQSEDAAGRDFTINGMYLVLSNDNGPNKELVDFHGGIHHLKSGSIKGIGGSLEDKISEDPKRILRYARMLHGYGDSKKIPEEDKKCFMSKGPELMKKMDRKTMMGEFKKGMKKDDDSKGLLSIFKDLGLLGSLFPGKVIDDELPKELDEIGDKHMPLAWMLRMNDPESLEDLDFDPEDLKKIGFLIKSLGVSENMDADSLCDLSKGYMCSGLSSRKLKDWTTKLGGMENSLIDGFLNYQKAPRVKLYMTDEGGAEHIADEFSDLIDPFTGKKNLQGMDERKKSLELDMFRKHMHYMNPA